MCSSEATCRPKAAFPGCRSCRLLKAAVPTMDFWSSFSSSFRLSSPRGSFMVWGHTPCDAARHGIVAIPTPVLSRNILAAALLSRSVVTLGNVAFVARDHLDMPAPGDTRPARFGIEIHDRVFEGLYTPISRAVDFCASQLNRLHFLTIQGYLGLVFGALVALLLVIAIWP